MIDLYIRSAKCDRPVIRVSRPTIILAIDPGSSLSFDDLRRRVSVSLSLSLSNSAAILSAGVAIGPRGHTCLRAC